MNPTESDFEQLRARLEILERQVARLSEARSGAPAVEQVTPPPLPALDTPPVAHSEQPPTPSPEPTRPQETAHRGLARIADSDFGRWFGGLSAANWIAAAGAVMFLIGAVYGLTVSFRRGWVSPEVRVAIGLGFGLASGFGAARCLAAARRLPGVTLLAVGSGVWTFALYYGAREMYLFPNELGFAGAGLAVILAGTIAARFRNDWALAVALATGLAAPLLFAGKRGSVPALLAYLAALLGAQLALHYLSKTGASWTISRRIGSTLTWLVALVGISMTRTMDADSTLIALGALAVVSQCLAWLPAHPERPSKPAQASVLGFLGVALCCFAVWRHVYWSHESFAWLLLALAVCALALTPYARRREDPPTRGAIMVLLSIGLALQATALLLAWRWVVLAWGLGALLLAIAAKFTHRDNKPPETALFAASIVTMAASVVWIVIWHGPVREDSIFFNPVFAGGALTGAAWAFLASIASPFQRIAFPLLQLVAVNVLASEFSRLGPDIASPDSSQKLHLGTVLATLAYALAGVGQWLRASLYEESPSRAFAFRWAGYFWIVIASAKLLIFDLSRTDLLLRAIAALSLGGLLIGAAIWADKKRPR